MGKIVEVYREFILSGSNDYLQLRQNGDIWKVSYLSALGMNPNILAGDWDDLDHPNHWIPDLSSSRTEPRLILNASNFGPDGYVPINTGFEVLSSWKTGIPTQRIEGGRIMKQSIGRGSFERFLKMLEDEKVYGNAEIISRGKANDFVL